MSYNRVFPWGRDHSVFALAFVLSVVGGCSCGSTPGNNDLGGGDMPNNDGMQDMPDGFVIPDMGPANCGEPATNLDPDNDGVDSSLDNCDCVANPTQLDADGDRFGDACDNCPNSSNGFPPDYQLDTDGDGLGNACEGMTVVDPTADTDGDGVPDVSDNCANVANGVAQDNQADGDDDLIGDACDNCPTVANYDQADSNGSPPGDACPPATDTDSDGIPDTFDNCPGVSNDTQADTDADGRGNPCDNCPNVPNYDQADAVPGTPEGTACEGGGGTIPDTDMDGVPNPSDNCVSDSNPTQLDTDSDLLGDACDNCPSVANFFQEDLDMDNTGDACETIAPVPTGPLCVDSMTGSTLLAPNLYFVIDISGSMDDPADPNNPTGPSRMTVMKTALNALAPSITMNFNVGIGVYPARSDTGTGDVCHQSQLPDEILDLLPGNTAMQFTNSYAPINANGYTPTSTALRRTRERQLYNYPGDPFNATRPKAVVLITDGLPNSPSNQCSNSGTAQTTGLADSITQAGLLFDNGVPVYVLGFTGVSANAMRQIANEGLGFAASDPTSRWYEVSSTTTITNALNAIASVTVSCTSILNPTANTDFDRASVVIEHDGGTVPVPRSTTNGWRLITTPQNAVELTGSFCTQLTTLAQSLQNPEVRVRIPCDSTCPGNMEICGNLIDDDCDGQTDEGCVILCNCDMPTTQCNAQNMGCPPPMCMPTAEICDGINNDCDTMIDEGCCANPMTETCNGLDDDCNGIIDDNIPPTECTQCAAEICDDVDNDCDMVIDEGCPIS